jgi:hypothetical protein
MDNLFGTLEWRSLRSIADADERAEATIALFGQQLCAEFVTHMYMRDTRNVLKYVLIHATNHKRGRRLMKDAIWSVTPDGTFTAFERNSPEQMVLLSGEPDLRPLARRLRAAFVNRVVRMEPIYDWLDGELYRQTHLHTVLREMRDSGEIEFSEYAGKFAFSKNPLVTFPNA